MTFVKEIISKESLVKDVFGHDIKVDFTIDGKEILLEIISPNIIDISYSKLTDLVNIFGTSDIFVTEVDRLYDTGAYDFAYYEFRIKCH